MKYIYILFAFSIFGWASAYADSPSEPLPIENCAFDADTNSTEIAPADPTISIYPNPVKNSATISFTYETIDKISILNIVGIEVKSLVPDGHTNEVRINLQDLQPGVYFLSAYHNGSKLITKKFLKEE
jgi:hypothetical protein